MGGVSIFLPSLAGGGAERCSAVVANALSARGTAVTLVLAKADGPFLETLNPSVRVIDLGTRSTWRALPGLVKHLRETRPTVLFSAMNHANVVAALAHRAAYSRARLVLSEHIHLSSLMKDFRGPSMRVTLALMKLTYSWANAVVAVSDGVAKDLLQHVKLAPQRVLTIYNPVVDDRLRRLSQQAPTHPWLARPDAPVVLAAGRLIAQKDFATLLNAFAILRQQRRARLVILGDGELRMQLVREAGRLGIASDVSFPGFEPNPFAAMRAAAVFVLSSRFEGLPTVLIEALACGARVVSTDCPSGPREVLEDGRWGALVPVGDARALAAAVAAALDQSDPPDVRARAAEFSDERAVAKYVAALGAIS